MTVDEIEKEIAVIKAGVSDYEAAHGREDQLHAKVLRAIADGAPNAAELAEAALKTEAIDFPRYCA